MKHWLGNGALCLTRAEHVLDHDHSGRSSLITDKLNNTDKFDNKIQEDRHFTLDDLHSFFPKISRALPHEIVTIHLGY